METRNDGHEGSDRMGRKPATPARWQAALARAIAEGIEVRQVAGSGAWIATSTTDPHAAYAVDGSTCACDAAAHGDPVCKHRAAFLAVRGVLALPPAPAIDPEPTDAELAATERAIAAPDVEARARERQIKLGRSHGVPLQENFPEGARAMGQSRDEDPDDDPDPSPVAASPPTCRECAGSGTVRYGCGGGLSNWVEERCRWCQGTGRAPFPAAGSPVPASPPVVRLAAAVEEALVLARGVRFAWIDRSGDVAITASTDGRYTLLSDRAAGRLALACGDGPNWWRLDVNTANLATTVQGRPDRAGADVIRLVKHLANSAAQLSAEEQVRLAMMRERIAGTDRLAA